MPVMSIDQRQDGHPISNNNSNEQEQKWPVDTLWICPNCKTKNYGQKCGICDTCKPTAIVCKCGHENAYNSQYCSACGAHLGKKKGSGKRIILLAVIGVLLLLVIGFFTVHIWTETTCAEPSVCIICGKKSYEVSNHSYGKWTVTVNPGCETAGEQSRKCSACGYIDKEEIPATGHSEGSWTKTVAPTCTSGGSEVLKCTVCGKGLKTRSVAALGHDYEKGYCKLCQKRDPDVIFGNSGSTQWNLTQDGILTFSGQGAMADYGFSGKQPWAAYAKQIKTVVVEKGVTGIGSGAFKGMTKLESVSLPESGLKKIGDAAFYGCSALKKINIPDSIYTVRDYTFKGCTSLGSVRLPKDLVKIGKGAFESCTALTYVFIPGEVEIISDWSFKGCSALVEVDMTWANATKIGENAFKKCSKLKKIALPSNIQVLGNSAFYGIGATSFTVPKTVTKIGAWCFARANLTTITFKGNAPKIGEGAFNKITLTGYYPKGNTTWTENVRKNYGGTITWKAN